MSFNLKKNKTANAFFLLLKGIAMGAANKVPGVSGGIVALVGGFYEKLIFSFQRLNGKALVLLLNGRFKSFWEYVNGSFLSLIFGGVIISYFSVSLLLDYLLERYETLVLGGFFGMILASLYLIFKQIDKWNKNTLLALFLGFSFGLVLTFARPASENDHLVFVFFCGIISVSGMTIPGLSGSFLLLILGNYNLLLVDAVNALFHVLSEATVMNFDSFSDPYMKRLLVIMFVFALGSLSGLILFSNLLKWVLEHHPKQTLSAIIGFIGGTLILVYPWRTKEYLYNEEGSLLLNSVGNPSLANYSYYLPDFHDPQTYGVFLTLILGASVLFILDYYDKKRPS